MSHLNPDTGMRKFKSSQKGESTHSADKTYKKNLKF